MKIVTAVVRPHQVETIKEALQQIDVQGMSVMETQGFGRQGGHTETYRGTEYQISFTPKSTIQIVIDDDSVDKVIETIVNSARTGKIGDGKIWVAPVDRLIRIRTGEEGDSAV